ncbi:MAG: signal peptide peptidase SppA [Bdellovibrionales bacterium]|nr:signal peptide peptidase SppA [Bdellovibrionales bacterium]
MKKFLSAIKYIFYSIVIFGFLALVGGVVTIINPPEKKIDKSSILYLELEGVIINGRKFLDDLRKYASNDNIKGVLIRVDSPGGVVGPSQEIYSEIKRVREEYNKPVVVSIGAVAASGAYYASVAADKIITNPGSMVGSIGVIMEFANLEKLYEWAKIKRFSINTGAYKDSGAEYRSMRPDEKELFQDMINQVHEQFKVAVAEGRNLKRDLVDQYADGRIFTGQFAVKMGFADQVGTLTDAKRQIGEMTGLGEDPEMYKPPKKRGDIFEMFADPEFDGRALGTKINVELYGVPLFMIPSPVNFIRKSI